MVITVNVFNLYGGRILEVAILGEFDPVPETERFRRWTDTVYPCYDINNRYMGYMDHGIFHNMREGWYCVFCSFETGSFWRAVLHDIKHLFCVRKRRTG